jgi:hypothetical protein
MATVQDVLLPILGGVAGLNPYLGSGIQSAMSVQQALRESRRREEEAAQREEEETAEEDRRKAEEDQLRRGAISVAQALGKFSGPDIDAIRGPLLGGDSRFIDIGLQTLREYNKKSVEDALKAPEEATRTARLLNLKDLGDQVRTALPTDHPQYAVAQHISSELYNGNEKMEAPALNLLKSLGEPPPQPKDRAPVSAGEGWFYDPDTGEYIEPPPGYGSGGGQTPQQRVAANNALAAAETKLKNLQAEMDFVLRVQRNPKFTGNTPKEEAKVAAVRGREAQEIERLKGLMKYEYDTINTLKSQNPSRSGGASSPSTGGGGRVRWNPQDNSVTPVSG